VLHCVLAGKRSISIVDRS